ncbi:MAG TPA: nucleotidyltransferase domain-containing protein, partial [Bacteroidales bacterium]|nr:nucleotidyltransferase domain-containing protein [Bacteroidales bacterium]
NFLYLALVGSRCRGDYKEDSDFDIAIVSPIDVMRRAKKEKYGDYYFCFNVRPINIFNIVQDMELSYYRIDTKQFVKGKDDEAFLKSRH